MPISTMQCNERTRSATKPWPRDRDAGSPAATTNKGRATASGLLDGQIRASLVPCPDNTPQEAGHMECPRWLVVSMVAAACHVIAHAADTKPHVLLVLADDLGTPSIRFREGTRL
jgi:hypothetical protein